MKRAYFRIFENSKQCELVFELKVSTSGTQSLQEIRAVRIYSENVKSLLEHIEEKVSKTVQSQDDSENDNKENISKGIKVFFTQNGSTVNEKIICEELIKAGKPAVLQVLDQQFLVLMNAPLILNITLPSVLFAKFSIRPTKFRALYADKQLCIFHWYKSADKEDWTVVSNKTSYTPSQDDINCFVKLRCTPRSKLLEGPPVEVISETPIIEMGSLPVCPFMKRHELTKQKLIGSDCFRVVSYNTLADRYTDKNQFPYCAPNALCIDYRKQLISKELLGYNADIICLQEVDSCIYYNYFANKFKRTGYESVFYKKGNKIPEGLACFYNKSRFQLMEAKLLVLNEELENNKVFDYIAKMVNTNSTVKECFMKQLTSLQVVTLRDKGSNKIIIVANTHLYYHSEAGHIRLFQAAIAMEYLKQIYTKRKMHTKTKVSVIFCGDFNSSPSSGVYDFFTEGVVLPDHPEWKQQPDLEVKSPIQHQFKFGSAYGTPDFTNYTEGFKACLDYIFYDETSFAVSSIVPIPNETVLAENIALPSKVFPSDHIALIANLKWL